MQHKKKLTFAWNISALGTDKDNWILTGIIDKSYFSKVEVGEKYYFEDIGLRNVICGYRPDDIAKILENVVYNHLIIAGHKVFVGKHGTKEIDFIAERNGETIYIQVCYLLTGENVMEREFGNLLAIPDNYKKYVVSMDMMTAPNTFKGIEHKYIPDFCKELTAD